MIIGITGTDGAGEKWDGVNYDPNHYLQGCQLFLKKIAATCTGSVRTHFARLIELDYEFTK